MCIGVGAAVGAAAHVTHATASEAFGKKMKKKKLKPTKLLNKNVDELSEFRSFSFSFLFVKRLPLKL